MGENKEAGGVKFDSEYIDIVVDKGPDASIVGIEDARGNSIRVGEWLRRGHDGQWALRLQLKDWAAPQKDEGITGENKEAGGVKQSLRRRLVNIVRLAMESGVTCSGLAEDIKANTAERYAERIEKELIAPLAKESIELRGKVISGFYAEQYPSYAQGMPTHELQEFATAEELNAIVERLQKLENAVSLSAAVYVVSDNGCLLPLDAMHQYPSHYPHVVQYEEHRRAVGTLYAALHLLCDQITKSKAVDKHGHKVTNNIRYREACKLVGIEPPPLSATKE
jgi:hypothetical protein